MPFELPYYYYFELPYCTSIKSIRFSFISIKLSRQTFLTRTFNHHPCKSLKSDGEGNEGGILNQHDVNMFSTSSFNHTFSLLLDSGMRVYAHVLRYLPIHPHVKSRLDVGRRAERAMVVLTRTVGGEQFYSSLLK